MLPRLALTVFDGYHFLRHGCSWANVCRIAEKHKQRTFVGRSQVYSFLEAMVCVVAIAVASKIPIVEDEEERAPIPIVKWSIQFACHVQ